MSKRRLVGKGRRRYSEAEKAAAVDLAMSIGVRPAARESGVPHPTLFRWWRDASTGCEAGGASEPVESCAKEQSEASEAQGLTGESAATQATAEGASARAKQRRRVARKYTPSQRAAILEDAAKLGVTAAADKHGVSRWSVNEWRRKQERAIAGRGDDPTSGPDPASIEVQRDREIVNEWKRNPGLGPSQVRNQLRRKGVKVSVHTARRVMEEAGYRPPKVERREHDKEFEAVRPNHLWHLDFVQRYINKASTFSLIIIDDFSRFVVGHGVDDAERADMVIKAFEEAVARYGRPEMVIHDKGSAFWAWNGISRFTALLVELGVDQIVAEEKEWNGKLENFNGNLATEFFNVHRFYDVGEMKRRLAAHLSWYNHRRTHHGLGGLLVPADRQFGRVDEVLARIDAGVVGELDRDPADLRGRALELFKVVSTGGQAEIWLMGQKLWPT